MNIKKYLASSFLVFIIFGLIDFLFDFFLLTPINKTLTILWRHNIIFWLEPVLYIAAALIFVLLFAFIYKGKGLSEGIILGMLIGLLVGGINAFRQFEVYPLPLILPILWFIESLIQYIAAGLVAALVYKPIK